MARLTIGVESLKRGWIVDRDIWAGDQLMISAGVEITDGLINTLLRRGISQVQVAADSEAAAVVQPAASTDRFRKLLQSTKAVMATHNVETAIPAEMLEEATVQIEGFFNDLETGQEVDVNAARPLIRQLVKTFSERSNYAIKLLDLEEVDQYTYRHSMNVGLLYMMVASDWYADEADLEEAVFGAVLHDLGKARVGSEIINFPGKLNDEQWAKMQLHPVWGAELLEASGASELAIKLARSHHERLDGKGYPDGLQADQVDRDIRLSAICDVYDALTTKRSYKHKMDFARAIDIIIQGCGTHFDSAIVHHFVSKLGRYPVGTFVELSSGEAAVVVRTNPQALSRPVVSRVLSAGGEPLNVAEELDLCEQSDVFIVDIAVSKELAG